MTISPVVGGTAVPPEDGLPPFRRFLDIEGKEYGKKLLIRLFFVTPSEEEISATEQKYKFSTGTTMYVIAARMPWILKASDISTPLFDFCGSVGFAGDFSEDIVRLVIKQRVFSLVGAAHWGNWCDSRFAATSELKILLC